MTKAKPHSSDVINDIRDYWWSPDFMALMAKRWKLSQVNSMLDVGCGIGHWGQMLAPYLSEDYQLMGIDPESEWIIGATERSKQKGIELHCSYQIGNAESIPFPDNHFDMVTCQTVLIHVKDVSVALKEMLRVLKPGGLIAVAEPNNAASSIILNNLNYNDNIDDILSYIRFVLICQRGRENLGKGNPSRGDIIPYYFHQVKIDDIQVHLSDLADFFIPPYNTPRERITLTNLQSEAQGLWNEIEVEYKQYFLAGGGEAHEFVEYWNQVIRNKDKIIEGYKNKTLCSPGGMIMYLISGRK